MRSLDRAEKEWDLSTVYTKQLQTLIQRIKIFSTIKIATLGPKGTSSEAATQYLISQLSDKRREYTLFPTYEEAFEDLLSGHSNLLIVANAYKGIDKFYMSTEIRFLLSFVFQTPLYGVAANSGNLGLDNRSLKIATHHAPSSLIPWFLPDITNKYEIIHTQSTSEAALKVHKGEADLCVTTANACRMYELEFISRTRPIVMLWSVFVPKSPNLS